MTIRGARPDDEDFIRELILELVSDELQVSMFPETIRAQLLDMQYRARMAGVSQNYPAAAQEIICDSNSAIGWLVTTRTADEIRLVDIIVSKSRRGCGAGTAALEHLIRESDECGRPLRLTVRRDNPALRLYTRAGFQTTAQDELNMSLERKSRASHKPRS